MIVKLPSDHSNKIIFDWLSFTCYYTPHEVIDRLGLGQLQFKVVPGVKGFRNRLYFDGISIHYDYGRGGDQYKGLIWIEMSGQGCRVFESFSECSDFESILFWCLSDESLNLTRLDVAYDDMQDQILDMSTLVRDTLDGFFVFRGQYYEVTQSSIGSSIVFGSPQSDFRCRIYDKSAERHCDSSFHWVRVELQLRRDRATEFVRIMSELNFGEVFCGVLHHYLWFAKRTKDTNKSRWVMAEYWMRFIGNASKISLYVKPGVEYNLDRCKDYVYNMAGNAVDCLIKILGYEQFVDELNHRRIKSNKKYDDLVWEHGGFIDL